MLREYYRRHLPHYQPPGATYHVVFRLVGSLPAEVIHRLVQEQQNEERYLSGVLGPSKQHEANTAQRTQYFEKFDLWLDCSASGPQWLRESSIAGAVSEAIHFRDKKEYDLISYCIMSNHVHMVVRIDEDVYVGRRVSSSYRVTAILANLKWYTALKCNRLLRRKGAFWQHESYDHIIRSDEELQSTVWYVLTNPVSAGLVDVWEDWPWAYCKWVQKTEQPKELDRL